ncbi:rab guanine nucleotide exchange factor S2 [Rhizina undulata]
MEKSSDADLCMASPSTPLGHRHSKDSIGKLFESLNLAPNTNPEDMPPVPPTSLTTLLHPVLRTDTISYQDFVEVIHAPKPKASMPRLASGSFSAMSLPGIASLGSSNTTPSPSHSPSTSLSGLFMSRKDSDASSSVNPSPNNTPAPNTQPPGQGLKETKFFKRTLVEDIEPTLRLDLAPGLSWLARRNVLAAVTDGSLVIDPMVKVAMPCATCGESRVDEKHERAHRMRTSEAVNAQKYPLCAYCVGRVRSVCDYVAFLRAWKEGLWKAEKEADEEAAWEEGVRLRERMFWARVGGGVIPAFFRTEVSHRPSEEEAEKSEGANVERKLEVKVKSDKAIDAPPKTPTMKPSFNDDSDSDAGRLEVPKKRLSRGDPFLTPERQIVREKDILHPPPRRSEDSMARSEYERSINDTGSVIRHILPSRSEDGDSISSRVTLTEPDAVSEFEIGAREDAASELHVCGREDDEKCEISMKIEESSLPPLPPFPTTDVEANSATSAKEPENQTLEEPMQGIPGSW